MLRMMPVADAKKAEAYYAKSDVGYYLKADDLHRSWGGKASERLGLQGRPEFEHFKRLLHGLDPHTGKQLTARLDEERLAAWDITASVPKGVTTVIERGDSRVHGLLWEANRRAMADLEKLATTRVRKGGKDADRVTGNLVWYSVEHAETRPTEEDNMPDWDRHIHNVVANITWDAKERQWKAVKFRPIMELRKYFDRRFDLYLSTLLADAGYEIETKWQPDPRGGVKYYSWDIRGIPQSVIDKFSRRSTEVADTEAKVLDRIDKTNGNAPERLSAVARDKLGATSRRQKREDLTLDECRDYWNRRITDDEGRQIAETIKRALRGEAAQPPQRAAKAVDHAMRHHFEQYSAVPLHELMITAMEHSMGGAMPVELEHEAVRQGLLTRQVEGRWWATTDALMKEEDYLVGVAAGGRSKREPITVDDRLQRGTLSDDQWAVVRGMLGSNNLVNLLEGPAGAGKSYVLKKFDEGMQLAGKNVIYLATTSDASGLLAHEGFTVHTVAHFLLDPRLQDSAKHSTIVCDEASMLGHVDAVQLFRTAERLGATLLFVADPLQHGAVPRGALLHVLKEYAGIRPFQLREIRRQEDAEYKAAVQQLAAGNTLGGFDTLDDRGWVREIENDEDRYRHLAADYVQALNDRKSVLVVSPTHAEAAMITAEIRSQLRTAKKLGEHEQMFSRLVQVNASQAEREQAKTYRTGDVLVFHQNAKGGFAKGQRLTVNDASQVPLSEAAKFQIYRPETIALAAGDRLRITGTLKTLDGKHVLKNGTVRTVAGFTEGGNIRLDNNWVIAADAGLFRYGFVDTSFASQGKTVQRVLLGMSSASAPAMSSEQMYVSASRGKEWLRLYTDSKEMVRDAVQRSSQKLTALDLRKKPTSTLRDRIRKLFERRRRWVMIERMRAAWEHTRPAEAHRERVVVAQAERIGRDR